MAYYRCARCGKRINPRWVTAISTTRYRWKLCQRCTELDHMYLRLMKNYVIHLSKKYQYRKVKVLHTSEPIKREGEQK